MIIPDKAILQNARVHFKAQKLSQGERKQRIQQNLKFRPIMVGLKMYSSYGWYIFSNKEGIYIKRKKSFLSFQ